MHGYREFSLIFTVFAPPLDMRLRTLKTPFLVSKFSKIFTFAVRRANYSDASCTRGRLTHRFEASMMSGKTNFQSNKS
jgi:hypothetical protein